MPRVILWLYACLLQGYVMPNAAESGVRAQEVMDFVKAVCDYARAKGAEEIAVTVKSECILNISAAVQTFICENAMRRTAFMTCIRSGEDGLGKAGALREIPDTGAAAASDARDLGIR
jgi:hypothetical protein